MPPFETDEELISYWQWWHMAGVEHGYAEEPSGWLHSSDTENAAPKSEPVAPIQTSNIKQSVSLHPHQNKNAEQQNYSRHNLADPAALADHPKELPNSYDDIAQWWETSDDLVMISGNGPRIFPVLKPSPKLLIISDMPAEDDNISLFTGASGTLLSNILQAVRIESDDAAILSILPQYSLDTSMELDRKHYWSQIAQHLIALIEPQNIMLVGNFPKAIITEKDIAENRRSLQNINHNQRSIPLSASAHPRTLVEKPTLKRAAWRDWLKLRESLHEIGVVQP